MPVVVATYYDEKTNDVRRRGIVRGDTDDEVTKIVTDHALPGEVIGLYPHPIEDDSKFSPGYTEIPLSSA